MLSLDCPVIWHFWALRDNTDRTIKCIALTEVSLAPHSAWPHPSWKGGHACTVVGSVQQCAVGFLAGMSFHAMFKDVHCCRFIPPHPTPPYPTPPYPSSRLQGFGPRPFFVSPGCVFDVSSPCRGPCILAERRYAMLCLHAQNLAAFLNPTSPHPPKQNPP